MLPLAGCQNKLRALVSKAPPGRQHGQAGLAGEMCPQQHRGPWPLALEQKRLSVPCLLSEQYAGVGDTMATEDLGQGHVRGSVLTKVENGGLTPDQNHRWFTEAARGCGGRQQAAAACISILLSALSRIISFDFCLSPFRLL